MKEEEFIRFNKDGFILSIFVVFIIWLIYWIEFRFGKNFNDYGIYPRLLKGLKGILFSPFIHSGTSHMFNNSIPFLVLVNILFSFYKDFAFKILLYGMLLTGILTWIIGREAYHIGLSGVIYMLFSFTFFSGIIKQHYRLIAVSLVVIFLYGSMIWYILPVKEGISWEGHLSGFLVGLILAYVFRKKGMQKREREYGKSEFDSFFDENGDFIGDVKEDTKTISDEQPHKE